MDAPNANAGQLGLANESVFLHSIVSSGKAPSGFGFFAGSIPQGREGHLILGGFDAASVAGPFSNFSISNNTSVGDHPCSLQVVVE